MILHKKIPFILCLWLCTLLSAQTSRVDSLERVLATFKGNNHEKGNLLIDISNEYRFADTAKCRMYIMEALNLTQRAGLDDVRKRAYMALGNYYRSSGQFYLVHSNYKKAEKLCIQLNDREYLCRVYYNLMSVFLLIEDKENILYYIDKILETASEWYDLTTYTLLDSLKIPQTDQMPLWIFAAQYTKGWAMSNISTNKQELLDYYLDLFQNSMLNEENKIQIALECGRLLIEMNRHQEALYYLHLTREFYETYSNIYDIMRTMSFGYALLAESYAVLNKMDSAKYYMEKAGEAPAMDHNTKIINYRARIAFESAKGNYENALEIHKEYFSFVDSISNVGKSIDIARMKNWYELEQKDNENELLHLEKQKQQKLILILAGALVLIFALLALLIVIYRKTSDKNSELKKLHTVKDKLFSVISHDLRSPMAALVSMLRLENFDAEMPERFFKDISSRVEDTFNLLDNLLRWSKNQMQRIVPSPVSFNLKEEIDEITVGLQNIAHVKKITLTNLCEDHQVFADRDMFAVIVRNLVTNALKYSNLEGEVKIAAQLANDNKMITISVNDAGIGMSQEVQDNLFKLSQTKSAKGTNNESGTGLGLVLCADLVKMNGGTIWFESKEGIGTTFFFTLMSECVDK
ncbi:MAG: HAMP domain-containing histidine kinase [Marinilabiliaceae bacterium]|nr:HAMP domain-containing histidine kinase [Marinilabiliaceae bacterium]